MNSTKEDSFIIDLSAKDGLDKSELSNIYEKVSENKKYGDIIWCNNLPDDDESKNLIEKIEKELMNNNDTFSRFPNDYIHGLMCLDVYDEDLKENDTKIFGNDVNWMIDEICNVPEKDYEVPISAAFFNEKLKSILKKKGSVFASVIYTNHKLGQIVVAFKGIEMDIKSLFSENGALSFSFKSSILNDYVPQLAKCYEVTKRANELAEKLNYFLSFTGYSNGAWLAEYAVYFTNRYFKNRNSKAVLFESPGIVKQKDDLDSNIINKDSFFDLNDLNIVCYLTTPHMMNSSNKHIGNVYRLFINNDISNEKSIKRVEFLEKIGKIPVVGEKLKSKLKNLHFILNGLLSVSSNENLKEMLKIFDHKTGQPKYIQSIANWPLVNFDFEKDYTENVEKMLEYPVDLIIDLIPFSKSFRIISDNLKNILHNLISYVKTSLIEKVAPGLHLLTNVLIEVCLNDNLDLSHFDDPQFYVRPTELELDDNFKNSTDSFNNFFSDISEENINKEFSNLIGLIKMTDADTYDLKKKRNSSITQAFKIKKTRFFSNIKSKFQFKTNYNSIKSIDHNEKNDDETIKNLQSSSQISLENDEGDDKKSKETKLEGKFELIFNKSFELNEVEYFSADLDINDDVKNIEWCLLRLSKIVLEFNKPSKIVYIQLNELKESFLVEFNIKHYNTSKGVFKIVSQKDLVTIDALKEKMIRFCQLYPQLRDTLSIEQVTKQVVITNDMLEKKRVYIQKLNFEEMRDLYLNKRVRNILLYGPSGIGKSTAATEFGYHLKNNDVNFVVQHFVMDSLVHIEANYIENLFSEFNLDGAILNNSNHQLQLKLINQKLTSCKSNILFIFDNVEYETKSTDLLKDIITNLPENVYVIATTRTANHQFLKYFQHKIELGYLSKDEAKELMTKSLVSLNFEDEYLNGILNSFDTNEYIPLRIEVVNSLLKSTKYKRDINEVIMLIKEKMIFEKLFESLFLNKEADPKDLLVNIAVMEPDDINVRLMTALLGDEKFKCLEILKNLSIVNERRAKESRTFLLSIHREVQDELRKYLKKKLSKEELARIYSNNMEVFHNELKGDKLSIKYDLKQIDKFIAEFDEELIKIEKVKRDYENEFECLHILGTLYLDKTFKAHKALELFQKSLIKLEKIGEQGDMNYDESLALSQKWIGYCYRELYMIPEALDKLKQSLEIYKKLPSQGNSYNEVIADLLNSIGANYKDVFDFENSILCLEEAFELYKKIYPNLDHTSISRVYNNKGLYFKDYAYQYNEAIKYFELSLEINHKASQSSSHKDKANSQIEEARALCNIGGCQSILGNYEKAVEYFTKSLHIFYKVYNINEGEEIPVPEIATLLYIFGDVYLRMGDYEKCIEYFELSLNCLLEINKGHPDNIEIANTHNSIGYVYLKQLNFDKAIENLEKSLQIYDEVDKDNVEKDAVYINLGLVYVENGEYTKSIQNLEKALEICESKSELQRQVNTAEAYNYLGRCYCELKSYKTCASYFTKSLDIYYMVYPNKNDSAIALTLNNQAKYFHDIEQYEDAIKSLKQSVEIYYQVYIDHDHLDIANILLDIGKCYLKMKNNADSISALKNALEIFYKLNNKDQNNENVAKTLNLIGLNYENLKNYKQSIQFIDKSINIYKSVSKEKDSLDLALVLNNGGRLHEKVEEYQKALDYSLESIAMILRLNHLNLEEMGDLSFIIGKCYKALGKKEKALKFLKQSLAIFKINNENQKNVQNIKEIETNIEEIQS